MMRLVVFLVLATISFSACKKDSDGSQNASSGTGPANSSTSSVAKAPAAGDHVLYMFDGYHFYEATVISIDGTKSKLKRDDEYLDRELKDIYRIPKAGDKITVKPGDFVAAQYGQLPTWPTAEVVAVDDNKITVKRIISGKVEELSPERVLSVSPDAAAKIRVVATKKTK